MTDEKFSFKFVREDRVTKEVTNLDGLVNLLLTFSLTLLPHWCKTSSPYLEPVSNY